MRRHQSLATFVLYGSLLSILAFLVLSRPPIPYYALLLVPISLAALLYELVGSTLVALIAMLGVAMAIALDPDAGRRATTLAEAWPILLVYLAVGPVVGWLTARERERERELVSAAARLHVVQEITQAINSSLELEQTLQTVMAETRRLIPFERAAVLLREGELLRVVAVGEGSRVSIDTVDELFPVAGSAAGQAILRKREWRGGPDEVPGYPDSRQFTPPNGSCLIVPLLFNGSATGAFVLGGRGLGLRTGARLTSLRQIADQMAIAIENARLYAAERRWSEQLAAIGEACQEIAASSDLQRTLSLVMRKATETLPMDAGALFTLDPGTNAYRVAISHNLSPERVARISVAFEEGVPGWVVKNRRALFIPDTRHDERVHPTIVAEGIMSLLAVPMIAHGKVVGVLNLFCRADTDAFDEDALRLGQVFADQAAVFLENARLVDELRQAATELEFRIEERTRQLQEAQAQMLHSEKMAAVGRLAASVAHEVNNPLQAIALHLQLIADEGLSLESQQQMEIVQDELSHIANIVLQLLDFQRPKEGKRTLQRVSVLLDEVLALADKQLQQANVAVIRKDDGEPPQVMVDGDQLKQVFLNLILNAVEAMPGGGDLCIRTWARGRHLTISFQDSGLGMEADVQAQLFEPFFSTKHTGTGLGLAVSHEIVCNHGGTLRASSMLGHGATFTIQLPLPQELSA